VRCKGAIGINEPNPGWIGASGLQETLSDGFPFAQVTRQREDIDVLVYVLAQRFESRIRRPIIHQ